MSDGSFTVNQCANEIMCGETFDYDNSSWSFDCFDEGNNGSCTKDADCGVDSWGETERCAIMTM